MTDVVHRRVIDIHGFQEFGLSPHVTPQDSVLFLPKQGERPPIHHSLLPDVSVVVVIPVVAVVFVLVIVVVYCIRGKIVDVVFAP